jgi:hypothetical protein
MAKPWDLDNREVLAAFCVDLDRGLDEREVKARRERYGTNLRFLDIHLCRGPSASRFVITASNIVAQGRAL